MTNLFLEHKKHTPSIGENVKAFLMSYRELREVENGIYSGEIQGIFKMKLVEKNSNVQQIEIQMPTSKKGEEFGVELYSQLLLPVDAKSLSACRDVFIVEEDVFGITIISSSKILKEKNGIGATLIVITERDGITKSQISILGREETN